MESLGPLDPSLTCPVCGASLPVRPYANYTGTLPPGATPPYEDLLGQPSYEVCPTCDFEFGNDDNPGTAPPVSFDQYRDEWHRRTSR